MIEKALEPEPDPYFWDLKPETEFGRKMLELRRKIVASRVPLLDREGLEHEIADRRGGVRHDDE